MWESSLATEQVTELLEMELEEDRGFRPDGALRWSAPGVEPLPRSRRQVAVSVTDLSRRGWMQCEFSVVIDCAPLADTVPDGIGRLWLTADGNASERTLALLHRTTPFDVTDTEPTTAGLIDPESADDEADRHVVEPLEAAFGPASFPATVANLIRHALTPTNGYWLDARVWRTCCFLLAASGHRDLAAQVIARVRTSSLAGNDRPERVDEFEAWLSGAEIPTELRWTTPDSTEPDHWPTTPPPGEVVPARALWRDDSHTIPSFPPVDEEPLGDTFAGLDLEIWLGGMSILDLEFDTLDIRGTFGDPYQPENLPIVERHLLDTFPSWAHATDERHRDLLDRYQRFVGELARTTLGGEWVAAINSAGYFDPVVALSSGETFTPAEFLKRALTERTGRFLADLHDDGSPAAPDSTAAPAPTVHSGDDAIAAVVRHITDHGIDYATQGLTAEPFSAGWAVFEPFTPDLADPLSFLDTPVGQAVFYIGYDGRIEKYSSSLSPTECEQQFLRGSGNQD